MRLGVSELVTTAREAVLNPSNPWSDSYPLSGIKESSTLLVRDIVTSLAAMQKGPRIIFTTAFNQYA